MKRITAILTALLMVVMMVGAGTSALAAEEKTFVDDMEMDFPHVHSRSDYSSCEVNDSIEANLYGKVGPVGSANNSVTDKTVWYVWKINGTINSFKLHAQFTNGLGKPEEIKVETSKDGKKWNVVPFNYTKLTFDDEYFFNYDKAYFLISDLTNKSAIPAGQKFIRVSLLPYTHKDSVNWNILLDRLEVKYNADSSKPADKPADKPAEDKPADKPEDKPTEDKPAEESSVAEDEVSEQEEESVVTEDESTPADVETETEESSEEKQEGTKKNNTMVWLLVALGVVVVAGIVAVSIILAKGHKKPADMDDDTNDQNEEK